MSIWSWEYCSGASRNVQLQLAGLYLTKLNVKIRIDLRSEEKQIKFSPFVMCISFSCNRKLQEKNAMEYVVFF